MTLYKYKSEEEFGIDIKKILNILGYKVYSEVFNYDMVIKKGSKVAILELKLNVSDVLLEQLQDRKPYANLVIGIVPYKRDKYGYQNNHISRVKKEFVNNNKILLIFIDAKRILETFEKYDKWEIDKQKRRFRKNRNYYSFDNIPLKTYHFLKYICFDYVDIKGKFEIRSNRNTSKNLIDSLEDYQLRGNPGCKSDKQLSPAKNSCNLILNYLRKHSKCYTYKEIWNAIGEDLHWASYNSMVSSLRMWNTKSYVSVKKFIERRENNNKKKKI